MLEAAGTGTGVTGSGVSTGCSGCAICGAEAGTGADAEGRLGSGSASGASTNRQEPVGMSGIGGAEAQASEKTVSAAGLTARKEHSDKNEKTKAANMTATTNAAASGTIIIT